MTPHKRTRKPINCRSSRSQASVNITQRASSGGSPPMSKDGASKTGKKGRRVVRCRKESGTRRGPGHISLRVAIEALPDNVLLDIFDFYHREADLHWGLGPWPWPWNRLVHVCQRWRYLVFGSPLRLDLCLRCISNTPVRETLDCWPPLPIEIYLERPYDEDNIVTTWLLLPDGTCLDDPYDDPIDVDNIIATLEHLDRVRKIWIHNPTSSQLERLVPMMQEPFPALTLLQLWAGADEAVPVLPDMFLGGSAQRLQTLDLGGISFPGLPGLLLSATDLSSLSLERIPHTGYISPEAMVTGLSASTRLTDLIIRFESPASRPDRRSRHPPPLTRVVLPALTNLVFQGVSEYLEDLVARIDAPRLQSLHISFFNQVIFDIQQLPYFIYHAGILRSSSHATVIVANDHVEINIYPPNGTDPPKQLNLRIYCRAVDWQVSSMAQICDQFSFLPSIIEQLDIHVRYFDRESTWQVDMEDMQWLELFRSFTAVRTLRMCRKLQSLIVSALKELTGERATEVLPALDSLYLEVYPSRSEQQAIGPFITARQYSDHPVAVHRWERPLF